jgi:hypothetical protein
MTIECHRRRGNPRKHARHQQNPILAIASHSPQVKL